MATAIATEKKTAGTATRNVGRVVQVIGPVLDVEFEPEHLPEIYNALELEDSSGGFPVRLTAEVQQHIGQNQVRAVAMSSTDGVSRGMKVTDTGRSITAPVGSAPLGRILNVLGEPVDGGDPLPKDVERWPIHRETPKLLCRRSRLPPHRPRETKPHDPDPDRGPGARDRPRRDRSARHADGAVDGERRTQRRRSRTHARRSLRDLRRCGQQRR
jgi:hypothetical protein